MIIMSYEDRLGGFVEANWSMGRDDVMKGVCSWGESADDEITELNKEVSDLKDQRANSIPRERVEALLDEITASCSIDVTRFLVIQKLELLCNNSINKGVNDGKL